MAREQYQRLYHRLMAKVMVSFPDDLLARIDATATRRGMTRSAYLAAAAERDMRRLEPDEFDAIVERSRLRLAPTGAFESADVVRAERDSRR